MDNRTFERLYEEYTYLRQASRMDLALAKAVAARRMGFGMPRSQNSWRVVCRLFSKVILRLKSTLPGTAHTTRTPLSLP